MPILWVPPSSTLLANLLLGSWKECADAARSWVFSPAAYLLPRRSSTFFMSSISRAPSSISPKLSASNSKLFWAHSWARSHIRLSDCSSGKSYSSCGAWPSSNGCGHWLSSAPRCCAASLKEELCAVAAASFGELSSAESLFWCGLELLGGE